MHFVVTSLFDKHPKSLKLFNYTAHSNNFERFEAGRQRLALGETVVKSHITHSEKRFSFAVLYLGQQHIIGHISLDMDTAIFEEMKEEVQPYFESSNLGEVLRIMQLYFGPQKYSINTLFKDEKIKVLNEILTHNLDSASMMLRGIYEDNYHLMNTLVQNDLPVKLQYKEIVQYVLNEDLERFFKQELLDASEIKRIVSEIKKWNVQIEDDKAIQLVANKSILKAITRLKNDYTNIERMERLNIVFEQMEKLAISSAKSWRSQNEYFAIATNPTVYNENVNDELWRTTFEQVGRNLGIGASIKEIFESA
jgi:hypothetical protein